VTRRLIVILLAATCAYASLGLAAFAAPTRHTRIVVKSTRVTLHLPKLGHTLVSSNTARVPRRLRDYFGTLQLVGVDGKRGPRARIGQPIVFKDHNGRKLFSLVLVTRYDSKRGRLRVSLKLRNIGTRAYRSKSAVVTSVVTIGYRR